MRYLQQVSWGILLLIATLLCATFFYSLRTSAEPSSLWVNGGELTKLVIDEDVEASSPYLQKDCIDKSMYRRVYSYSPSYDSWNETSKEQLPKACWKSMSFGDVGSTNQGRFIRVGKVGAAAYYNANNPLFPFKNKLAMLRGNGSSNFYSFNLFDDVKTQLELKNAGPYDEYAQEPTEYLWQLKHPVTGTILAVNKIGVSKNGRWSVIETSSSFIRFNPDTKELLAFEKPQYGYGGGLNPTYELTISNDGRYAIIGGGNQYNNMFVLYDLSTCVPDAVNPLEAATGCGKRDLQTDLFASNGGDNRASEFYFSSDATTISYNAYKDGVLKHYVVTTPGQGQFGLEYVALGDSFSSGEGDNNGKLYYKAGTDGNGQVVNDTGVDGFPYWREKCHLSVRSYPYILANTAQLRPNQFQSVACSGAVQNDIRGTFEPKDTIYLGHFKQYKNFLKLNKSSILSVKQTALDNFIPGREAQIKFVEKYKPRVATIGVGGNDIDFGTKLAECVNPVGPTCRYAVNYRSSIIPEMQTLYTNLVSTYQSLKDASRSTTFYAVGYPQLVTLGGDCAVNVHLDELEREYAFFVVDYINRTVKEAAASAGIEYLDITYSIAGNNLCSGVKNVAINGATYGDDIDITGQETRYFGMLGQESYHPNELGQKFIANSIQAQLNGQPINTFVPCLPPAPCLERGDGSMPNVPAYFGTYTDPLLVKQSFLVRTVGAHVQAFKFIKRAHEIPIESAKDINFRPAAIVSISLYSDPVELGTLVVNDNGNIEGAVTIPPNTQPGYHTVHLRAPLASGEIIELYESIYVYAEETDADGDGILNQDEICESVTPSNTDQDGDGIDDACDGYIGQEPDTIAPSVTGALSVEPNAQGWHTADMTITWSATDPTPSSGIVSQPQPTVATLEGEHTYTSEPVCDNAGNCSEGSMTLKIDKTAPTTGIAVWSQNPKAITQTTSVSLQLNDQHSGIAEAEYFIGENDPGQGNGATMSLADSKASTVFGTDFVTGVYKLSFRVRDVAGNWSLVTSDYLVVYDASSGAKIRGSRIVTPSLASGDILPGLISQAQSDQAKFAFSVRYGKDGAIVGSSDMQFTYTIGTNCHRRPIPPGCHVFELNATQIDWLATEGLNQSKGIFRGTATMRIDNTLQEVSFVVTSVDGTRIGPSFEDEFALAVFPLGAPMSSEPLYQLTTKKIGKGNIRISF